MKSYIAIEHIITYHNDNVIFNVSGLFCAASYFELADLSKACLDFAERCIKVGRAEKLLFSTRCYSHHKATRTLFDKVTMLISFFWLLHYTITPVTAMKDVVFLASSVSP